MKLEMKESVLVVTREKGDPAYRNGGWGSAESRLLFHIKRMLNAQGYDLIKTRMWKDGHMVSVEQQYLRTRDPKSVGPQVYIWNPSWAIYDAGMYLMENGTVTLCVERDVFKPCLFYVGTV